MRVLYEDLSPKYKELKRLVDGLVLGRKEARWHYESRLKKEESFALKLETGRVLKPDQPDDFFACTLVVENYSRIAHAEGQVRSWFKFDFRKPKDPKETHLAPFSFQFDDLRLYVRWADMAGEKSTQCNGLLFEVQIKTFLQHAWGIATHDFIYKAEKVDWSTSRIAYQVKAMLENAELSIGSAGSLTGSEMLNKVDRDSSSLTSTIAEIKKRWPKDRLPSDLRRLAENVEDLQFVLRVESPDLWDAVDEATRQGEGAATLDLSPYSAILRALIHKKGTPLFDALKRNRGNAKIFVPVEVELPTLPSQIMERIVQPPQIPR